MPSVGIRIAALVACRRVAALTDGILAERRRTPRVAATLGAIARITLKARSVHSVAIGLTGRDALIVIAAADAVAVSVAEGGVSVGVAACLSDTVTGEADAVDAGGGGPSLVAALVGVGLTDYTGAVQTIVAASVSGAIAVVQTGPTTTDIANGGRASTGVFTQAFAATSATGFARVAGIATVAAARTRCFVADLTQITGGGIATHADVLSAGLVLVAVIHIDTSDTADLVGAHGLRRGTPYVLDRWTAAAVVVLYRGADFARLVGTGLPDGAITCVTAPYALDSAVGLIVCSQALKSAEAPVLANSGAGVADHAGTHLVGQDALGAEIAIGTISVVTAGDALAVLAGRCARRWVTDHVVCLGVASVHTGLAEIRAVCVDIAVQAEREVVRICTAIDVGGALGADLGVKRSGTDVAICAGCALIIAIAKRARAAHA